MRLQRWAWAAVVTAVLATGCGDGGDGESGEGAPPEAATTTSSTVPLDPPTTIPGTEPASSFQDGFDGISPATRADLARLQAEVDQGHQPWRLDPVAVARAYLVDLGITDPVMGEPREAGRRTSEVRFDAGAGATGYVVVRRLPEGSLPYVVRVESVKVDNLIVEREAGRVHVEGYSRAPGTLRAWVGRFGAEGEEEESVPVDIGPVTVTLAVDREEYPQVVQLRHEGTDGTVGITVFRVQQVAPPAGTRPRGAGLTSASEVTHTGIGPIMVGSSLDEVLAEAGVPMVLRSTPYCDGLRPATGLDGIDLIFPAERDVRFMVVTVSTDVVATDVGIRVGSSEADVLAAYPGIERQGSGASGRLVDRSDDQDGRALVFQIRDSRVAGMQAGLGAEADELCA